MPRPAVRLAILGLAFLVAPARPVRGEGDEPTAPKGPALEVRFYDVGALTAGRRDVQIDRGPFNVLDPDMTNDESQPLFGREGDEPYRPLGGTADVIELVKAGVGRPGTWEEEGATITEAGLTDVAVKHTAAVQDEVEGFLRQLERETLATVTVDVVALADEPPEGASVAQAIESGAARPVAAVRASGFVGQTCGAFHGGERAFVAARDVEVAKDAKTNDPQVGVQSEGIAMRFSATSASDPIRLVVDGWYADVDGSRSREAGNESVDLPTIRGVRFHDSLAVKPGVWTWASTHGGTSFAVRATARPFQVPVGSTGPPRRQPSLAPGPAGPVRERRFNVNDLAQRSESRRGVTIHLTPSNYTAPAPPALPEAVFAYPVEALADTIKAILDPASWDREGVGIDMRSNVLLVRHDDRHLDAIERVLERVRARYLKPVRARTRVVTVPASSVSGRWAGGTLEEAAALLALPGARVVDKGSVRMLPGARDAFVSGVSRRYVGDYDVSIAEGASIANPKVFEVLEGLSLDVLPVRVLGGGAYVCQVYVDRSTWRGSRNATTTLGEIECPSIGLTRFRGSVVLATDETRVVSAGSDADEATFVLLTLTED